MPRCLPSHGPLPSAGPQPAPREHVIQLAGAGVPRGRPPDGDQKEDPLVRTSEGGDNDGGSRAGARWRWMSREAAVLPPSTSSDAARHDTVISSAWTSCTASRRARLRFSFNITPLWPTGPAIYAI